VASWSKNFLLLRSCSGLTVRQRCRRADSRTETSRIEARPCSYRWQFRVRPYKPRFRPFHSRMLPSDADFPVPVGSKMRKLVKTQNPLKAELSLAGSSRSSLALAAVRRLEEMLARYGGNRPTLLPPALIKKDLSPTVGDPHLPSTNRTPSFRA
jgi:hypothetical protein